MKQEFCKGHRVEFIGHPSGLSLGVDVGELGSVLGSYGDDEFIIVRWDKYQPYRHSCGGLCEDGHGWNVSQRFIVHCVEDFGEFEANLAQGTIDALLGG